MLKFSIAVAVALTCVPYVSAQGKAPCVAPDYIIKIDTPRKMHQKYWCILSGNGARPANGDYGVWQLISGKFLKGDRRTGLMLLQRAAKANFFPARDRWLNERLNKKMAGRRDFEDVVAIMSKWAANGDVHAAYKISHLFSTNVRRKELFGVDDVVRRMKWLRIRQSLRAQKQGQSWRGQRRGITYRVVRYLELSPKTTQKDIKKSQVMAQDWFRKHRPAALGFCDLCKANWHLRKPI